MAIYSGFSTINRTKKFKVTDFELVKTDIINHFNIRRGEKLMNPNFGTIIWDLLFEPMSDSLREEITADVKSIFSYESRVELDSIIITEYEHGLQLELDVTYIPEDQSDKIYLDFNRNSVGFK